MTRSTSFFEPRITLTRSCSLVGCTSRMRRVPVEAPPTKAMILLVEDEDTLRRVVRDLLEQEGYAVCEARDGSEALEQGLDPALIHAVVQVESGYNARAVSRRGAAGDHCPATVGGAIGEVGGKLAVAVEEAQAAGRKYINVASQILAGK